MATTVAGQYHEVKWRSQRQDTMKSHPARPQCEERSGKTGVILTSSSNANGVMRVICPALSLLHPVKEASDRSFTQDRKQAESYAAALLERPLGFTTSATETARSGSVATTMDEIPQALLQNVKDSFAILIDCRLRAYASFIARAGASASCAATEQALTRLLETGRQMATTDASFNFVVHDEAQGALIDEDDQEDERPLSVEIHLDVQFGKSNEDGRTVPVKITAPGHITGGSGSADSVTIHIDTQHLLQEMIDQASLVVSAVVEVANRASVVPEPNFPRSSSYLLMPPPPAKKRLPMNEASFVSGLEMLSQAAAAAGLAGSMSTKMSEMAQDIEHQEPDLGVLVSDDEDQVVSHLSPEQCASIVDGVFGELDDDFCLGPPAKRFKTSEAPRSTRADMTNNTHQD